MAAKALKFPEVERTQKIRPLIITKREVLIVLHCCLETSLHSSTLSTGRAQVYQGIHPTDGQKRYE